MDELTTLFYETKPTTLTLDCYGTLVDWEGGAATALRGIYGFSHALVSDDTLIDLFLELDAIEIRKAIFSYSTVLQNVATGIAERLWGRSDPKLSKAFAHSLPHWPVFPETNKALERLSHHVRLAIISNVDDDLISQTLQAIDVPFDQVITSQHTKCYKPDIPIFEHALRTLNEEPSKIIHVAEGLCEARPAQHLGMKSLWVRRSLRSDDKSGAVPNAQARNLTTIVNAMERATSS